MSPTILDTLIKEAAKAAGVGIKKIFVKRIDDTRTKIDIEWGEPGTEAVVDEKK